MSSLVVWLAIVALLSGSTGAAPLNQGDTTPKAPTSYVDYFPGTGLNVILSAPHGGDQEPSSILDRDAGCWDGNECIWSHDCGEKDYDNCDTTTVTDRNTLELASELHQSLCDRFGACPATVIMLLNRIKIDANREINEATFGVPEAVDVYNEYHGYITQERGNMGGMGLYIDLHGHGHSIQRAELGYLVSGSDLDSGDPIDPDTTSIRSLANYVGGDFDVLLRGVNSFGFFLEREGFDSVPSPSDPGPDGDSYFWGEYSTGTQVHGSRDGGQVDGIQIESPSDFRDESQRDQYVAALTNAIADYLATNYP